MKVADLTGALLDYWVARAEGKLLCSEWDSSAVDGILIGTGEGDLEPFAPSTDWAHGGPIIEREHLVVWPYRLLDYEDRANGVQQDYAAKRIGMFDPQAIGSTYLIAAMRAYVAGRFGAEVPDV